MLEAIIIVCAIYGLAFFIKETSGPFDIMDRLRNTLMRNQYVGVFFFKLLSCYYCIGCWCGGIVYLLSAETFKWQFLILWTLAGGAISLIFNEIRGWLLRE